MVLYNVPNTWMLEVEKSAVLEPRSLNRGMDYLTLKTELFRGLLSALLEQSEYKIVIE